MTQPARPAVAHSPVHHHLVQATIRPLDEDGVTVARLGTALWALVAVVSWLYRPRLLAAGHGWWPWTTLAGVLLGLVGWAWCARRRRRRPRPSLPAGPAPDGRLAPDGDVG